MVKVSTTGMAVSLKADLRFPITGQQGHGHQIIQTLIFKGIKRNFYNVRSIRSFRKQMVFEQIE